MIKTPKDVKLSLALKQNIARRKQSQQQNIGEDQASENNNIGNNRTIDNFNNNLVDAPISEENQPREKRGSKGKNEENPHHNGDD